MISKSCYVFIDSSNLFYGGKRRLGWRVDYHKLLRYLREKGKNIVVIANSDNTARIIKDRYQGNFIDFSRIKEVIEE